MPASAPATLDTCRLGRVDYIDTLHLQRRLRAAREAGALRDTLLVLEHDPVITCGRHTRAADIAVARTQATPLVPVERGGEATWHGPGQVVAYPIVSIDLVDGDVKELVRRLEQALIDTLADHLIAAGREPGLPGVWVDAETPRRRKIASVGMRIKGGVTFHGIALNVANDLRAFDVFTPCGITGVTMTSIARERHRDDASPAQLRAMLRLTETQLEQHIAAQFQLEHAQIDRATLDHIAAAYPAPAPDLHLPDPAPDRTDAIRIPLTTGAFA